jgi:2-polyprenyl-3-methyl-5-hydroxy-6-metoxy-1,4-benzoquinol methylase
MTTDSSQCPICSQSVTSVLTTQLRHGPGVVYHCASCDHGFLPFQSTTELVNYYASSEYRNTFSHSAEPRGTNARELFETYQNYQVDRIARIKPYCTSHTRLLDVGASAGQFLDGIRNDVASCSAIELNKECCDFLQTFLKIDSDSRPLAESKFAGAQFDIVTSFHVLEHTSDPIAFIRDLTGVAAPGARIVIEVPNIRDSLVSSWQLPHHSKFFYHSAHAQYFSANSLAGAALQAGLSNDKITIDFEQDYNLLNHLNWLLNDTPQADCHMGLSDLQLPMGDSDVQSWLESEMIDLDTRYREKLKELGVSSNLVLTIEIP